jgi:hypothetical protein
MVAGAHRGGSEEASGEEANKRSDEMNTTEFLTMAKALRSAVADAESNLMQFLYDGESKSEVWAPSGKTYLEFIGSHNLCKVERFLAWKRVRGAHGAGAVAGLGVEGVVAAGALKTKAEQAEVLARVRQFEKVNGTAVSEQSAGKFASDAKIRSLGLSGHTKGYLQLIRENGILREKLKAAEQTIAALRAELRDLKPAKKVRGAARATA